MIKTERNDPTEVDDKLKEVANGEKQEQEVEVNCNRNSEQDEL